MLYIFEKEKKSLILDLFHLYLANYEFHIKNRTTTTYMVYLK